MSDTCQEISAATAKEMSPQEAQDALDQMVQTSQELDNQISILKIRLGLQKIAPDVCPNCSRGSGIRAYLRRGEWACLLCGYGGVLR